MADIGDLATILKVKNAIGGIGSSPYEEGGAEDGGTNVKGEETDSLISGFASPFLITLALAGIGSGVAAMFFTVSSIVDVASVLLFVLAPLTVYQKAKLKELGGMRGQINEMRMSVNEFSAENEKLTQNIDNLATEVNDLQTVEGELDDLAKKAGGQVDRLIKIVEEQSEIQSKILKGLEVEVMQNVLDLALKSDTDQDFTFNKKELRRLKINLSNIPGVEFDKANFDKLCVTDDEITVSEIMQMFRNLKDDTIPSEDNIFRLKPEELPGSSKQSKSPSGGSGIFSSFRISPSKSN